MKTTIVIEFVGLRAKMYALHVDGKKDTKKAKEIKSNVIARSITFDDYMRCLNNEIEAQAIMHKIEIARSISETKI